MKQINNSTNNFNNIYFYIIFSSFITKIRFFVQNAASPAVPDPAWWSSCAVVPGAYNFLTSDKETSNSTSCFWLQFVLSPRFLNTILSMITYPPYRSPAASFWPLPQWNAKKKWRIKLAWKYFKKMHFKSQVDKHIYFSLTSNAFGAARPHGGLYLVTIGISDWHTRTL